MGFGSFKLEPKPHKLNYDLAQQNHGFFDQMLEELFWLWQRGCRRMHVRRVLEGPVV